MGAYHEVRTERLYVKAPGTDRLRKTAAGWLRHLLATGWEETGRRVQSDHLEVRLERTTPAPVVTLRPRSSADEPGPRPRRERPPRSR
jgi:hypothetical protein